MRSSEDARRLAWCATLALAAGLGACAQHDPRQLALRDRIEQGALTPEDSERFFTGEREHQAVVSARRDVPPRLASALDRDLAQAVASGEVERARRPTPMAGVVPSPRWARPRCTGMPRWCACCCARGPRWMPWA